MVGCIENFIQGKQPPWSDGRYNVPKYIELALNNGRCMQTGARLGPETGGAASFETMDLFMDALEKQMKYGAAEYMMFFRNENERFNPVTFTQPFLSCFCADCVGRGLDINDGGALYPSVHGAGCMGIATVADSLAAIEEVVYTKKFVSIEKLKEALAANYAGFEDLRQVLLPDLELFNILPHHVLAKSQSQMIIEAPRPTSTIAPPVADEYSCHSP